MPAGSNARWPRACEDSPADPNRCKRTGFGEVSILIEPSGQGKHGMFEDRKMGGCLDCGWKIPYNRVFRWMLSKFVVIRSRRALMSWSHLITEQAADSDLRGLASQLGDFKFVTTD